MKLLIILLLAFSFEALACKPRGDFVAPTLVENVKSSPFIFWGKVLSIEELGRSRDPFGVKYKIVFAVQQNIKGLSAKETSKDFFRDSKVTLFSYANTCDTFAQTVEKEFECLIFASEKEKLILSGVLAGEASFCGEAKLVAQKVKQIATLK